MARPNSHERARLAAEREARRKQLEVNIADLTSQIGTATVAGAPSLYARRKQVMAELSCIPAPAVIYPEAARRFKPQDRRRIAIVRTEETQRGRTFVLRSAKPRIHDNSNSEEVVMSTTKKTEISTTNKLEIEPPSPNVKAKLRAESLCADRTIVRWWRGETIKDASAMRISAAAERLGIQRPVS